MVTDLVILSVFLVVAAGVIGYLAERVRQQRGGPAMRRVIELRPLPDERVRDYRADWVAAQARFVDDPDGAVRAADMLVERLMAERGYPPEQAKSEVLQHYWAAHEIAQADERGDADTDTLRRAMVHYRMVFSALLESAICR